MQEHMCSETTYLSVITSYSVSNSRYFRLDNGNGVNPRFEKKKCSETTCGKQEEIQVTKGNPLAGLVDDGNVGESGLERPREDLMALGTIPGGRREPHPRLLRQLLRPEVDAGTDVVDAQPRPVVEPEGHGERARIGVVPDPRRHGPVEAPVRQRRVRHRRDVVDVHPDVARGVLGDPLVLVRVELHRDGRRRVGVDRVEGLVEEPEEAAVGIRREVRGVRPDEERHAVALRAASTARHQVCGFLTEAQEILWIG